jgi:hypothetical protein
MIADAVRVLLLPSMIGSALAMTIACTSFDEAADPIERDGGSGDGGAQPSVDAGNPDGGGSASAAYRDAVLADGPVAYWRMGRTESQTLVPDETGKSGALLLSAVQTGEPGIFADDLAMAFDGVASFAEATSSSLLEFNGASPFTIECWLRHDVASHEYEDVIGLVAAADDTQHGYALYLRNAVPPAIYGWRDAPDAAGAQAGSPLPAKSAWGHYVMVFDGQNIRIFFDGEPKQTVAAQGALGPRPGAKFTIGRGSSDPTALFRGALDEIAVYPKALDGVTIAKHHDLGRTK